MRWPTVRRGRALAAVEQAAAAEQAERGQARTRPSSAFFPCWCGSLARPPCGRLDAERARHLRGAVADRVGTVSSAGDPAEHRPGQLGPAHLQIGDADHLPCAAEPGAPCRASGRAADDDLGCSESYSSAG